MAAPAGPRSGPDPAGSAGTVRPRGAHHRAPHPPEPPRRSPARALEQGPAARRGRARRHLGSAPFSRRGALWERGGAARGGTGVPRAAPAGREKGRGQT